VSGGTSGGTLLTPGIPGPGSVVTVGTFDGVHRGHWQVLQQVVAEARSRGLPAVLVTFHPHPLRIVRPEAAPPLLTTPAEKIEILAESGLDYVDLLPFTRALADYSPRRFVEEILLGKLRCRELIIGYDHGFGKDRSGDPETLRAIGRELGFGVRVVEPVSAGQEPVSSTRIRRAVQAGDMATAAAALGRPYAVRGTVVRGDGRGARLGFPTANLQVSHPDKLLPLEGIYAVRAVLREGTFDGVLHLGPRPTFTGSTPTVELHVFDWQGDLYGQQVRVDFHARVREVRHFASVAELVRAMEDDCRAARGLLSGQASDD